MCGGDSCLFGKIMRVVMAAFGALIGYLVYIILASTIMPEQIIYLIVALAVGSIVGFFIAPWVSKVLSRLMKRLEVKLKGLSSGEIWAGVIGIIIGLIIANLLFIPLSSIPVVGPYLGIFLNVSFGYLGLFTGIKKREEVMAFFSSMSSSKQTSENGEVSSKEKAVKNQGRLKSSGKILDTSVIIDGRILDICRSGFIEGPLIVPGFVLEELQHIADSSDGLKRNRGRRGLDILNRIRKDNSIQVKIVDNNFDEPEVDAKLIKLAKKMGLKILTNDFNLNKVAELHGVVVLNINDLANALKPVVLPGEEMTVQVLKDGKENGQGIAYLEDGTMVVVEGGKRRIGDTMPVVVTSVLQTSAGRMIFAKIKNVEKAV